MGLRARIKAKVREIIDRFTGEYSAAAPPPGSTIPYEKPVAPPKEVHVQKARIVRPQD